VRTSVNLLPFGYRKRRLLHRRLLQWCLVWTVCALAAVGGWLLKVRAYAGLSREAESVEQACEPLYETARQRDLMKNDLGKLHAQGTVLGQLRADRPLVALLGLASTSAQRCDGRLYIHGLTFQRQAAQRRPTAKTDRSRNKGKKPQQPAPKAPAAIWATVVYQGHALDNLAVATFVAGLRDTGLFRRVELQSSTGKPKADTLTRTFVVECDI